MNLDVASAAKHQDDLSNRRNAIVHERLLQWAKKVLDKSADKDPHIDEALIVLERACGERMAAIIHAEYLHLVSAQDAGGQYRYQSMPRHAHETMRAYRRRIYNVIGISPERAYQLLRMARVGIDCYLFQHDASWAALRP